MVGFDLEFGAVADAIRESAQVLEDSDTTFAVSRRIQRLERLATRTESSTEEEESSLLES